MFQAALVTLLGLAPAAATPPAGASGPAGHGAMVELQWQAPAGCPPASVIEEGIRHALPAAHQDVPPVRVVGVVSQIDADHWRVRLTLSSLDGQGERTLEGPSCLAVSDAAGLVIVLAINTELRARETGPPTTLAPPAPEPAVAASSAGWFMGLAAIADAGGLPRATVGGALSLAWHLPRLRLELAVGAFVPREGTIVGQGDIGARFKMVTAALRGCYPLRRGRFTAGPCVDLGLNWTHGAGFGPILAGEASSTAGLVGGGLVAEWRAFGRVVPYLGAGLELPLVRPQYSVEDVGGVHRPARVFVRGAAGVALQFR